MKTITISIVLTDAQYEELNREAEEKDCDVHGYVDHWMCSLLLDLTDFDTNSVTVNTDWYPILTLSRRYSMDLYLYVKYESDEERHWTAIRPLEGTQEEADQLAALLNKMNPDKDYTFVVENDEVD